MKRMKKNYCYKREETYYMVYTKEREKTRARAHARERERERMKKKNEGKEPKSRLFQ